VALTTAQCVLADVLAASAGIGRLELTFKDGKVELAWVHRRLAYVGDSVDEGTPRELARLLAARLESHRG
jgi:hypothetical protein